MGALAHADAMSTPPSAPVRLRLFSTPLGAGLLCGVLAAAVRQAGYFLYASHFLDDQYRYVHQAYNFSAFLSYWLTLLPVVFVLRQRKDLLRTLVVAGIAILYVIYSPHFWSKQSLPLFRWSIYCWEFPPRLICGIALGYFFNMSRRYWPVLALLASIPAIPTLLNYLTPLKSAVLPLTSDGIDNAPQAVMVAVLTTVAGVALPTFVIERECGRRARTDSR